MNLDLRCIISIVFVIRALNLTDSPDLLEHIACPCPLYAITTMHDVLYSVGSVYIYHELCNHCMLKYKLYIYMYTILYHNDPSPNRPRPTPSILFDVIHISPITCTVMHTNPQLLYRARIVLGFVIVYIKDMISCLLPNQWTPNCPLYPMQVQTVSCIPTVEFLRFLLFVE